MRYRKLGETGLRVSELGFGTIPILSGDVPVLPDYYSPSDEEAMAVMDSAFRLGCNLFDTAIVPEYGDAEVKLGKFARRVGREKIILSDKARFFHGDDMYQAVLASCENLGTWADLYFVHQVDEKNQDIVFGRYGALDALTDLKRQGKIRFAGVATHYYSVLLRGAEDDRVDVLQGSGNLLERGMLDRVAAQPIFRRKGFLVNKAYAAGILPAFFSVEALLSAALSYPVSSVLVGLGTRKQVKLAMGREHEFVLPPLEHVFSRLEQFFSPIPCDRCQKCRCPLGTDISTLFRQYNYHFLGKNYWALRKLDLSIRESATLCRSCAEVPCMKDCPRGIHIPQMMERILALVEAHVRKGYI